MRHLTLWLGIFMILILQLIQTEAAKNKKSLVVENILTDKDLKKLLRTKTNVLVCFYNSFKQAQNVIKTVKEVAENIKGEGTIALIDCSGEAKKMCKKLKIPTNTSFTLKHYKDGDFHKEYDRKLTVISMTNFMRDPTGDLPWEEDDSAADVLHIADPQSLLKLLKKEPKPILIMFYAPWCGYCKQLKPDYAEAATELKDYAVLAAMDVNRPENTGIRMQYNISGFPTLHYFMNGAIKYTYDGDNQKASIINFIKNPVAPPIKIQEPEWSDLDNEVVHLTTTSFEPVLKGEASVLVMFYAPWCGHCKKMKPEYEKAALHMKNEGIQGMLAAVDATKEPSLAQDFSIKGYPTVLYFSYGEKKWDVNVRESSKIIDFMRNPLEPPPPPPPEKPWADEKSEVVHLNEENFKPFLKKKKHVLVMFYAPWCGHCKKAKPEFSSAAEEYKDDPRIALAAVDCTTHSSVCSAFDVKGYPTLKYFSYYNKAQLNYSGGRTKEDFVQFLSNPMNPVSNPPPSMPPPEKWHADPSILTLSEKNFTAELKKHDIVLVMFYAPWCGYCKKMKPDYVVAANELMKEGFQKCLAMVDCTENPELAEKYQIQGFPTIKLFKNGKYLADYDGNRSVQDIKNFVSKHFATRDEFLPLKKTFYLNSIKIN